MCEIAVINPDVMSIEQTQQLGARFYDEQGDGLGFVMVKNRGDRFEYATYKSTEPHWQTIFSFLQRNWDESWRVVVHARNSTSADVNRESAHPISIDCDACEFDYVVHNGHVRNYRNKTNKLQTDGHHLNTSVDSEVIAHTVEELPNSVTALKNKTYRIYGNLNYLLFAEDGILVRSDEDYHVSEAFTMTCSPDIWDNPEENGFDTEAKNGWALAVPDGDAVHTEVKERKFRKRNRAATTTYTGIPGRGGADWSRYAYHADEEEAESEVEVDEEDEDYITIEYADYSEHEEISAIQVSPDTIRVIDNESGSSSYVHRKYDPKAYYYWSPEPTPDNIEELRAQAETKKDLETTGLDALFPDGEPEDDDRPEQEVTLEDFPELAVNEAIAEEMKTLIAQEIDGVTIRDVAEIDERILQSITTARDAAVTANAQTM